MSTKAVINRWCVILGYTEDKDRVCDIIRLILNDFQDDIRPILIKTILFVGEWDAKKAITKFTDWLRRNILEYRNNKISLPEDENEDTIPNLDSLNKSGMHPVQQYHVIREAIEYYVINCGPGLKMSHRRKELQFLLAECIIASQIGLRG